MYVYRESGGGGSLNRLFFRRGNLWHPLPFPLFTTKWPINLTKGLECKTHLHYSTSQIIGFLITRLKKRLLSNKLGEDIFPVIVQSIEVGLINHLERPSSLAELSRRVSKSFRRRAFNIKNYESTLVLHKSIPLFR